VNLLEKWELKLNEGKTKIVDANKEAFYFLGFALKINISAKGKRYPHVSPKEKAVEKVKWKGLKEQNKIARLLLCYFGNVFFYAFYIIYFTRLTDSFRQTYFGRNCPRVIYRDYRDFFLLFFINKNR